MPLFFFLCALVQLALLLKVLIAIKAKVSRSVLSHSISDLVGQQLQSLALLFVKKRWPSCSFFHGMWWPLTPNPARVVSFPSRERGVASSEIEFDTFCHVLWYLTETVEHFWRNSEIIEATCTTTIDNWCLWRRWSYVWVFLSAGLITLLELTVKSHLSDLLLQQWWAVQVVCMYGMLCFSLKGSHQNLLK